MESTIGSLKTTIKDLSQELKSAISATDKAQKAATTASNRCDAITKELEKLKAKIK